MTERGPSTEHDLDTLQIGEWLLEPELNQMSAGGSTVYLGALKTKLLAYLAQRPGQVASRDELAHAVWGGFASDHTITQHLALLRKSLSTHTEQAYIQTVPKRGYRLIAPVSKVHSGTLSATGAGIDASSSIDLSNINAIVIDDSDFVNDYLSAVLSTIGLRRVVTVTDAEAALRAFETQPFDLIISDVVMAPVSGLDLVKRIRTGNTPLDPFVAIIIMTSFTETDILGSSILFDVNGFLKKPASTEQIRQKLVQALTEDFQYRPALAYRHIDVDFVKHLSVRKDSLRGTISPEDSEHNQAGIEIAHLREGMVLAAPLRAISGELILPAGVTLSRTNIMRLRELASSVLRDKTAIVL